MVGNIEIMIGPSQMVLDVIYVLGLRMYGITKSPADDAGLVICKGYIIH